MAKKLTDPTRRYEFEELEVRRLLAVAWGAFPQLIDQDLAAANYAQYNGAGQTIAFIDLGIDYNHPAIQGNYTTGVDFTGSGSPIDTDGHGTGVAAIAVGNSFTFNNAKYQGIAQGAKAIALKVENGGNVPDSRYEAAFRWVIDHRTQYNITVVNASFGSGHYTTEGQRTVYADEMAELAADGVFIVAASGNDGASSPFGVEYPAADPNVFAAGSINSSDVISKFTERGSIMDIVAPGENVPTAYLVNGDETYLAATGTSFSAPAIAGAAAILKQIDPDFTPFDIMSILRASGSDNYDGDKEASPNTKLTFPRLDLDNAIALALARRGGQASAALVGANGVDNGLAYDRDGVLNFAWYDGSDHHVKYASQNDDGDWSGVRTIDAGSNVGAYLSLAMTSTGKPAMAYYDIFNADLKFARWDGSRWNVQTVDSKLSVGLYTSLAFDSQDHPIISYYYKNGGDLRVASNNGSAWTITTVDSNQDVGRHSSLAISRTGQWSVAYENSSNGQFKFARRSGSSWSTQTVDAGTRIAGGYISLTYDASNRPAMSYYDAYNADLKYALLSGSSWKSDTVASRNSQGLYTNLTFDSNGDADIVYFNKTGDAVFRATGGIGNWSVVELASGGGRFARVARYGNQSSVFSYIKVSTNDLVVAGF